MGLDENCDLSKEIDIAIMVDEFRRKLDVLKALPINQSGRRRKRRYLGRYFAHPMMQNRRAKRDDYKPSAALVTGHYVP
ncbi:hypothetical protein [Piscirickettsia salmonis]|uniref:hypothetical protein n=1 Tax=Piscirickettsia salmonis TaxID=1238 RepID=UPI0007C88355|nr:hypothetical protein A0O36_01977 [Piscirickettsiaceae bacterium NZ-RLO1]